MANKTNTAIGAAIIALAAAYYGWDLKTSDSSMSSNHELPKAALEQRGQEQAGRAAQDTGTAFNNTKSAHSKTQDDTAKIAQAFAQQRSNLQVHASGQVKAVLWDDTEGSKHQKFILQLRNGQTVLVAHNIDLSPRIQHLKKGDTVEFYGEYEYSSQGGVIHWTHVDPNKRHIDGWLKHDGQLYQ